jgi:hypothetical protein
MYETERLFRIVAPHFVCGVVAYSVSSTIFDTALIVSYMRGWSLNTLFKYAKKKGWTVEGPLTISYDPITCSELTERGE